MANPVFTNNQAFQAQGAQTAPAQDWGIERVGFDEQRPDVMTYDGTLTKALAFFVVAVGAAVSAAILAPGLANVFGIAAFVMTLVVVFTRSTNPLLLGATIALMGAAAGALSYIYEVAYGLDGIITQSLLGVATVAFVCLWLYRSGRVRVTSKSRRYLTIAVVAFVSYSLIAFGLGMFTGVYIYAMTIPGTSIPVGLLVGALGIFIGAWMIITDFDFIERGVTNGLPKKYEWVAAYGVVFSVIWLYTQILRVLSILRR